MWMEFLVEYDIKIEYIKGKENKVVDALSRRRYTLSSISSYKSDLMTRIYKYQSRDTFYLNQKKMIEQGNPKVFFIKDDKLFYFDNRLVIPL